MERISNDFFLLEEREPCLFVIEFTAKQPTDSDFDLYLEALDYVYSHSKDIFLLQDARLAVNYLSHSHRIKLGNFLIMNKEKMMLNCVGVAYVSQSFMYKALLKAVFAIHSMPVLYSVHDTYEEAQEWLQEQQKQAETEELASVQEAA